MVLNLKIICWLIDKKNLAYYIISFVLNVNDDFCFQYKK